MFDVIVKIVLTLAVSGILIGILPTSPFPGMIDNIGSLPYLAQLNWFFPVGKALACLSAWGAAILVYYGISWILRQLDIIGA